MSAIGTPQYPPSRGSYAGSRASPAPGSTQRSHTPSIHGSRTSLTRGSVSGDPAPLDLDPDLINPAETAPAGEPRDIPPQSPDDLAAFTLPGYEDPKKKKGGKGGISNTFKGGFGKMKGLFRKGPKEAPDVGTSGIEDDDDYATGSQEYLDKLETPGTSGGDKQSTMQKFQNLFKSKAPEMASPSPYQPGDIMQLKEQPPETLITFGNFINVMLILFIVAGIIMCACIGLEDGLYYLGPAFIGLAFFALVGKIFFTCFWKEDPLPDQLKPALEAYEKYLGGTKDPYAHKMYTRPRQVATYYGPMSTALKVDVVQMETFEYPRPAPPKMYDESIDTRLREPSPVPSSNRSFVQDPQSPVRASLDYSDDRDRLPFPSYT